MPFRTRVRGRSSLCSFWAEDNAILCPLASDKNRTLTKKRIPADIREVIARAHNSFVGHHGKEKTLAKIQSILETNKLLAAEFSDLTQLSDYVMQFISQCPVCQKLSTIRVPIQAETFTTATYEPHQMLNIDTIGPLTADEDQNCYILVIIDTFTRWIELFPVKT